MDTEQRKNVTAANREAWEEAAPRHRAINHARYVKNFLTPSYSCLSEIETEVLKSLDVIGKDVAQVCCNNGRELLSIKNMGAARVVGFDGAQGFLDQAQEYANAARVEAEFVCTDIYDIAPEYHENFDIVTITIGVLGWMPDLQRFFDVVTGLIRPGGVLFIYEQHPILDMIEPAEKSAPVVWELSYFTKEPYVETHGLDYYSGETYDAKPVMSFSHTMAEIIMAGVSSGMGVEHFEERPEHISNTWWNVEASGMGMPMSYTLVFRKA